MTKIKIDFDDDKRGVSILMPKMGRKAFRLYNVEPDENNIELVIETENMEFESQIDAFTYISGMGKNIKAELQKIR